jgi:hypothetical protein
MAGATHVAPAGLVQNRRCPPIRSAWDPRPGGALGPIEFGGTGNFDGPSSQDIPYRLLVTP